MTISSSAQAHEPLPELLALFPAAVPLVLPSLMLPMAPAPVFPSPVIQWVPAPEVLDNVAPVLTLYPALMRMAFSQFLLSYPA